MNYSNKLPYKEEGIILKNNLVIKKLDRAEESVKICKLNIKSQEKKLVEFNTKMDIIQSKLASISSIHSKQCENLISIYNKLMINIEVHNGIILELQKDLNINENNLQQLKSISI